MMSILQKANGLSSSTLGEIGTSIAIAAFTWALCRSLLSRAGAPGLSKRRSSVLLVSVFLLAFATHLAILARTGRRTGLQELASGKYRCRVADRTTLDCFLNETPHGGVSLDFAGPGADGIRNVDSFHGNLQPERGAFRVILVNTLSDGPGSAVQEETNVSTVLLRQTSRGVLDGSWTAGSKTLPFHMEWVR